MDILGLWRLSKRVYREIVFQSFFSLRVGGALPQKEDVGKSIAVLVKNAEKNVMVSKFIMAFFIVFLGAFTFFSGALDVDRELVAVYGVSTMLSTIMFMIVFMGLQVATSFVSSRVADLLIPLPITKRDVSKTILMCFIRIFDIPLIAATLTVPVSYGISYRSVSGSLTVLMSVVITEVFALALAILLALSFYSKVTRGGSRSLWGTLMRILYMFVWIIPTFIGYLITSFAMQMVGLMKALTQSFSYLLASLYPFSLGFLVSFATFLDVSDIRILILSTGSSLVYFSLAAYSFKWLLRRVEGIGTGGIIKISRGEVRDTFIKTNSPWLGIIKKDLRIALRSPSYFSILIMPVVQTVIFSLSLEFLYSSLSEASLGFIPFFIITLLMVLLLPPTLLAIESVAYSYVGSLPLRKRTLIFAKTFLSSASYLISLLALLFIILMKAPGFVFTIMLFGCIYMLSVVASITIETSSFPECSEKTSHRATCT
jgi:predicted permease